jgi:excinuclease UvrABC helicase subunit UvrB
VEALEEHWSPKQLEKKISQLKKQMLQSAKKMDFELAAEARDEMHRLQNLLLELQT